MDNQKPRVRIEQSVAAVFQIIDVDPDDHRHAARPREDGNMTAGASPAQHHATIAPIGGQEDGRRHVVGREDNAGWHDLVRFACQMSQHAIPEIAQVGPTRPEIGIVGRII